MLYLLLLNFWCETHVLWFLVEESQRLGIRQSWCFFVFGEQDKVKKDMKRSSRTLHCFVLSLMCARCDYKSEIVWQWQYLLYLLKEKPYLVQSKKKSKVISFVAATSNKDLLSKVLDKNLKNGKSKINSNQIPYSSDRTQWESEALK